jgi:ectoine hydroxylase-related dioxygenase (phytanoyl-CoA dioxygenase family)
MTKPRPVKFEFPMLIEELDHNGYAVLDCVCTPLPSFLTKLKKRTGWGTIFNQKSANDGRRTQIELDTITDVEIKDLNDIIESLSLFLKCFQSPFVAIHSQADCLEQTPHSDWNPASIPPPPHQDHITPYGVLVSLEDKTTLEIWPKSHRVIRQLKPENVENVKQAKREHSDGLITKRTKLAQEENHVNIALRRFRLRKKQLSLNCGQIVVFRGDLIHAGSAYIQDNYRVHCYLDAKHTKRRHDATFKLPEID